MRMFIGLILAFICLACEPNQQDPNDYPKYYQRSNLVWDNNYELVYQEHDFDTIAVSANRTKEDLIFRLRSSPNYWIQELHLQNDAKATFIFEESLTSDTLEYEYTLEHYHFWYANNLDEQFYFQVKSNHQLYRRFYFYWKKNSQHPDKRIYLRIPEVMPNQAKTMVEQHLIYDPFLEAGDTLEMISGAIIYNRKD
ncbi:MAG: hypothetical protein AAF705_14960 [Bacteroidota bacterium]